MPDNSKVTLVRRDGTLLEATPEQASRLTLLGYQRQTPEENIQQATSTAEENYYTSPGQKLTTAGEGIGAGLTFGATDYLFGDDETKKRAAYNPGTRMATETLGALAPLLLTEGGSAAASGGELANEAGAISRLAAKVPTSVLARGAEAITAGSSGLTKSVLRGAIEGGAYGGAGAADHAYLDGDPVTAEAVLHGIGWGAVIGGGISAAGHGIEALGNKQKSIVDAEKSAVTAEQEATNAKNAAEQARYESDLAKAKAAVKEPVPRGALNKTAGAEYGALQSEVKNLSLATKEALSAADASVKGTVDSLIARGETADLTAFNNSEVEFVRDVKRAGSLYDKVTKAVDSGKFDVASETAAEYTNHVSDIAKKINVDMPNPGKPLDELISLRSVHNELTSLPQTVEGFANLSAQKLERTIAALDKVPGLPFQNAQAVTEATTNFSKAMGLEASDLRSTWRAAKDLYKNEGKPGVEFTPPRAARVYEPKPAAEPKEEAPSFVRKVAGYALGGKAYAAARVAGTGKATAYAAYKGVKDAVTYGGRELAGIRAAAITRLRTAAGDYLPGAGRGVRAVAPRVDALATTLFGEKDTSTTDRKQLAANRVNEIQAFAPTAADTIYRAIEPLSATQPHLAPAMHAAGLQAFQALQNMIPKDPGVLSKLQTIWKPSDIHAVILAKQLEVFHDPVGAAEHMLQSGKFDPIKIESLKELAPNTWQDLRISLLQRITEPGIMAKMSYHDQIGLSTMLDIPIHSSMAPEYIATSQQMFLERNKPLSANPRMGQNGGMPNPSDNINATSSQKSTER